MKKENEQEEEESTNGRRYSMHFNEGLDMNGGNKVTPQHSERGGSVTHGETSSQVSQISTSIAGTKMKKNSSLPSISHSHASNPISGQNYYGSTDDEQSAYGLPALSNSKS